MKETSQFPGDKEQTFYYKRFGHMTLMIKLFLQFSMYITLRENASIGAINSILENNILGLQNVN